MDNETTLVRVFTYGFVALFAISATSCQTTNYQVRKMVEAGAHPILAACAIDTNQHCTGLEIAEIERLRAKQ